MFLVKTALLHLITKHIIRSSLSLPHFFEREGDNPLEYHTFPVKIVYLNFHGEIEMSSDNYFGQDNFKQLQRILQIHSMLLQ